MKINLAHIHNQVRQLREQAAALRSTQSSLLSYQHNLQVHWKGMEAESFRRTVDDHMDRLKAIASELDAISADVIREAEAVRREEELAEAQGDGA
jgi:uncharacterized protein YukE